MQIFAHIVITIALLWIGYHAIRLTYLGQKAVAFGKKTVKACQTPDHVDSTILIVGDSTAVGVGAQNPRQSLVGRLAADLPRTLINNSAINGLNTKALRTIIASTPSNSYDYVIIHTGGIDTISCTPLATTEKYLDLILQESKRVAKKEIFLISVNNTGLVPFFPSPINFLFTHRSRAISRIAGRLCSKYQCTHIPLFSERNDDELVTNPKKYISSDLIHPNDEGYGIWYNKIKSVLLPKIQ